MQTEKPSFRLTAERPPRRTKVILTAERIAFGTKTKTPYESAGRFSDFPASAFYKKDASGVSVTEKLSSSDFISVTDTYFR